MYEKQRKKYLSRGAVVSARALQYSFSLSGAAGGWSVVPPADWEERDEEN
jgi:hypothetical protein